MQNQYTLQNTKSISFLIQFYLEKTKDFDQDLFDTISGIADEEKDPERKKLYEQGYSSIQIESPRAKSLVGKQIKIKGENKTIRNTYIKNGLLVVEYEGGFDRARGSSTTMKQQFSLERPDDLYLAITSAQGVLQKPAQATTPKTQQTAEELIEKYRQQNN